MVTGVGSNFKDFCEEEYQTTKELLRTWSEMHKQRVNRMCNPQPGAQPSKRATIHDNKPPLCSGLAANLTVDEMDVVYINDEDYTGEDHDDNDNDKSEVTGSVRPL